MQNLLFIITEVKFMKKFLHAVCENCHGNKKIYIVNHKGNVYGKQSLMIIISSFSSCVPLLSQFRKSGFVQVQRGRRKGTILHRQKWLLSFQNDHFLYFLTIKHYGLKNEVFSTRRLCEWLRENRWQIVDSLRLLVM